MERRSDHREKTGGAKAGWSVSHEIIIVQKHEIDNISKMDGVLVLRD
jgi:hypothetical protein